MQPASTQSSEDDALATAPTTIVKVAGYLQALCGLFWALAGVQTVLSLRFRSPLVGVVPWLMTAGGVAMIWLGAKIYRAHGTAALAGTALGALCALGMTSWFIGTMLMGVFSCISLLLLPLAVAASIASALAIAPSRRASAARQRLSEQGLDLGL
jgi:hypothetical protein